MNTPITVFHITHYKAGSQWVFQVLTECAPDRIVAPQVDLSQFYVAPLIPGAIYPTTYVPYPRFMSTLAPEVNLDEKTYQFSPQDKAEIQNWHHFSVNKLPVRKFVVIRDLRDTLISLYFSIKVSHPLLSKDLTDAREMLATADFEEGFLKILTPRGRVQARIQSTWYPVCKRGNALLVRYEDLIADENAWFKKIIEYCEIDVPKSRLQEIISNNSFKKLSGRSPGNEDISSHFRKGISGDWKNYFTDAIKSRFKEVWGQHLIDTGYEKDLNW